MMHIFVAGATGTLGLPLVRELVARGHTVTGLTRSPHKRALLEALGAQAVVAAALDAPGLERAVRAAAPTHVVHMLTALPMRGPLREQDLVATNWLRVQGTANLLRAAIAAGARRIVGESFIYVYGYGDHGTRLLAEDDLPPIRERNAGLRATVEALRSLEQQLLDADHQGLIETVVLRYGLTYGPGNASTRAMVELLRRRRLPLVRGARGIAALVHNDDAAAATIAALERGRPGAIYNIVDDEPVAFNTYIAALAEAAGALRPLVAPRWLLRLFAPAAVESTMTRLPLSNARAREELAWQPRFPTYREGMRQMAQWLQAQEPVTSTLARSPR
jgi:nucleoside-diphosphate-sugar epimerase